MFQTAVERESGEVMSGRDDRGTSLLPKLAAYTHVTGLQGGSMEGLQGGSGRDYKEEAGGTTRRKRAGPVKLPID